MNKYAYLFLIFSVLYSCAFSPEESIVDASSKIKTEKKVIDVESKINAKEKDLYLNSLNSGTELVYESPKYREVLMDSTLQFKIINRADLFLSPRGSNVPKQLNYKKENRQLSISYFFYQAGQNKFIPYIKEESRTAINIDFYTIFEVFLHKENGKISHSPMAHCMETIFELKILIPANYSNGRKILFKGIELKKYPPCKGCQKKKAALRIQG
jgi:hypothetical protein